MPTLKTLLKTLMRDSMLDGFSLAGGTAPAYMNGANEALVEAFLNRRVRFFRIQEILEQMMEAYRPEKTDRLEAILDADNRARREAEKLI